MRPVVPPYRGISDAAPYIDQPGDTCPPDSGRNFRSTGTGQDRQTLKTRAGIADVFDRSFGDGPVQGMRVVPRASAITGYELGDCLDMAGGSSKYGGALTGQLWRLDVAPSLDWGFYYDVTGDGGPAANTVSSLAVNAAGTKLAAATNYIDSSGTLVTRVRCSHPDTPETALWSTKITLGVGTPTFTNAMVWSSTTDRLFVCVNQYIYVINGTTGAVVGSLPNGGWCQEAIACGVATISGIEYLFVAFNGSSVGAVLDSGVLVAAGSPASHFRSGVIKYQVVASDIVPLVQRRYGDGLDSGDTYFEDDHGTFRVSEHSSLAPHGAVITDMRVGTDGTVYVSRCNQAYGPNASFPPDATLTPNITVMAIDPDGVLAFETDVGSVIEIGLDGYYNDIPASSSEDPTISAIEVDDDAGEITAAGRKTAEGYSLWRLRSTDGVRVWAQNVMDATRSVRQAALRVSPTTRNVWVGGDRNNGWSGSTGQAHLFEIDRTTGEIVHAWDLGASVSALALAVLADGLVYGTDKV